VLQWDLASQEKNNKIKQNKHPRYSKHPAK
jgi:hypothetical protein